VLKTKRIPNGKLTQKESMSEEINIGMIPVISPGRMFRMKRENLRPTRQTGKRKMTR
jgi:hypothetical protein